VMIPVLQGCAVGGTTVINGAIIHRLPEPIHAQWERRGAIDELLSYRALDDVYRRMDQELGVDTTPAPALGRNNELMRDGLTGIGMHGNVIRRNVSGCEGSARCNQGCPGGRKQSMNVSYIPRSVAAGARVYATCRAERIIVRLGRVAGVEGRYRHPVEGGRGPLLRVMARHAVVVAASAIQTPNFLKHNGIGRRSGLVGEGLTSHPGTSVMAVFDSKVDMWRGATQGFETTELWDERLKLESVATPLEIAAARLPGYGRPLMERIATLGHVTQWGVQGRARTRGRVRPGWGGRASIRYDMQPDDVAIYRRGVRLLTRAAFAAGAREVYPNVHGLPDRVTSPDQIDAIERLSDDPRRFHFIMAHLFGTAVMHPDPSRGVVDAEGQSHELPGLYVADSSVFPTNMGVNPQHTIGAVAWRFGERLAERIRR
jgi:choline dehydrogenase-like flavoprotein